MIGRLLLKLNLWACAIIAGAFLLVPNSDAISPPPGVSAELNEILSQPEYQPRNRGSWTEAINKLIETGVQSIKNAVSNLLDQIFGSSGAGGRFNLPQWLAEIIFSLGNLLHLCILLGIIYLLYRIILPLIPRWAVSAGQDSALPSIPAETPAELSRLFEQRQWKELLTAIRLSLRRELTAKYGFSEAATDREVLRSVPAVPGNSSAAAISGLFNSVAREFESAVFAQRRIDEKAVSRFYQQFNSLPPAAADESIPEGEV